jgi:hypothetical protein
MLNAISFDVVFGLETCRLKNPFCMDIFLGKFEFHQIEVNFLYLCKFLYNKV